MDDFSQAGLSSLGFVDFMICSFKSDAEQPADPSSSYNASTGQIIIVVKPSDLGLGTGSTIVGFVAGSSQTTDPTNSLAGATEVWDSMPDSLTFTNNYTIVGTCP